MGHHSLAICLLVASMLIATTGCATRAAPATLATPDGVRFMLTDPAARSVSVAGTFNGWSVSSHPLTSEEPGVWTAVIALAPGEHHFMFVVDGVTWVTPPLAESYVDDGFGSSNAVVIVRPMER